MSVINDKEFGKITVRRSARATQIRLGVAPDGSLKASMPVYTPLYLLKGMLMTSRNELREMVSRAKPNYSFEHGMQIGKSHRLVVQPTDGTIVNISRYKQQIIVKLPPNQSIHHPEITQQIRKMIISALRLEAKSYLPQRLSFLAEKYGYGYAKSRFSHASSRWGSCSSNGTISLNIALMKLPFELIDYVIIHELSHTKQMNHSNTFWGLVEIADSKYKIHRRELKLHNPNI